MDLYEAMRSTGSTRYYEARDIPDDVLARVLDAARCAPSGGNRQPVRFLLVKDTAKKKRLRDLYLPIWDAYVDAIPQEKRVGAMLRLIENAGHFARHLDEVPVMAVICAKLSDVYPTDTKLGRISVVGGASIYPMVQNLILACRGEGIGTTLTTLLCAVEPEVKTLLAIPDEIATAAMVTLGYPAKGFPKQLKRRPLSEVVFLDSYGDVFPAVAGGG